MQVGATPQGRQPKGQKEDQKEIIKQAQDEKGHIPLTVHVTSHYGIWGGGVNRSASLEASVASQVGV
jgi:hypothetical protein